MSQNNDHRDEEVKGKTEITRILGVDIGTNIDWYPSEIEAVSFYNFKPNEVGKKFLRLHDLEVKVLSDNAELTINFETGEISLEEREILNPDWSVFNKLPLHEATPVVISILNQRNALVDALEQVLIHFNVVRGDAKLFGPELLLTVDTLLTNKEG